MEGFLRPEFNKVSNGLSSRVADEGWLLVQKLLSQKDKLANLANCAQAPASFSGQFAAVLYLAGEQLSVPVPVDRVVSNAGISMKEFFSSVEEQHLRLNPGAEPLVSLKRLKEHFLGASVAWKKYDELFPTLFASGFAAPAGASASSVGESKRLGWLVFCIGKCLTLGSGASVLEVYHLLVCVLELLLTHLQPDARGAALWDSLGGEGAASVRECYPIPEPARGALLAILKAHPAEAARLAPAMGKVVAELRATLGLQPGAAEEQAGGAPGLLFFGAEGAQHATAAKLKARYEALMAAAGAPFDDRFFLTAPPLPAAAAAAAAHSAAHSGARVPAPVANGCGGSSSVSSSCSPCRAPGACKSLSSGGRPSASAALLTPLRGANPLAGSGAYASTPVHMAQTPVSGQLDCVSWLRSAVHGLDADCASPALTRYFELCQPSVGAAIHERLERLCARLRSHLEPSELVDELKERCDLGKKLYHKMLLSFLQAEERRLGETGPLSALLVQDTFHTSLFACCLEAVIAAYDTYALAFPAIVEILNLHAFDFYKVIESFVKHEPELPKYLRSHFREVEINTLECYAWAEDSPLHALTAEFDALEDSPEGAPARRATAALQQFLRKVSYLAAQRVHEMCTRLLLRTPLVHQVWENLKVVIQTPLRHLMVGRHLDQLIMCTIYGVCKVNKRQDEPPKTFRDIIEQYKRQEKASAKVFREVRMGPTDAPQDIIAFYNKIFIPCMKDHLLRVLQETRLQRSPCATLLASADAKPGPLDAAGGVRDLASPQRVVGGRDVWISHPRTPSASMTPRTRTLYAFGDSPAFGNLSRADDLHRLNHNLNSAASDGSVAANALRALSSTPSHSSVPPSPLASHHLAAAQPPHAVAPAAPAPPPLKPQPAALSGGMPPPAGEPPPPRKRTLEGSGGMSRKQLQRRLNDDSVTIERSSSHGSSHGSSSPDGDAASSGGRDGSQ